MVPHLLAEILAIKVGLDYFLKSAWRNEAMLIVESDNKNAVDWVSNPDNYTGFFFFLVKEIARVLSYSD
ncbi:hypothetical protein V6N12_056681 [Hibiscus sabdariffa]|uniref:RNase H type-1 domain-containing protein n=1 Tax=Hibiscus sabdariffa TaxID=183260 RepID=A0ABR2AP86_9ROSI